MDSSHKTKNQMSLVLWKGFVDEFEKISGLASPMTAVTKVVANQKDALTRTKPNWSRTPKLEVPQGVPPASGPMPTMPSPTPPTV